MALPKSISHPPTDAEDGEMKPQHDWQSTARAAGWFDPEEVEKLRTERDYMKQQAQILAIEANAHKSTVHSIYQLCSGSTGEPGDWNGAKPVQEYIEKLHWVIRKASMLAKQAQDESLDELYASSRSVLRDAIEILDNATDAAREQP